MKKQRKHYRPQEKVAILRRHLLENEPISKLCDELGLQPTVFYRWQKEFFENGAAAFEQKARPNHSADQERIAYLEKKIQTKDEVLAELMAEHVALKKRLGNSDRGLGSARYAGPDRGFRPALRELELGGNARDSPPGYNWAVPGASALHNGVCARSAEPNPLNRSRGLQRGNQDWRPVGPASKESRNCPSIEHIAVVCSQSLEGLESPMKG